MRSLFNYVFFLGFFVERLKFNVLLYNIMNVLEYLYFIFLKGLLNLLFKLILKLVIFDNKEVFVYIIDVILLFC